MAELLIVGGLMIVASGLPLLKLKDWKTLNMLPSLLVPVLWFLVKSLSLILRLKITLTFALSLVLSTMKEALSLQVTATGFTAVTAQDLSGRF